MHGAGADAGPAAHAFVPVHAVNAFGVGSDGAFGAGFGAFSALDAGERTLLIRIHAQAGIFEFFSLTIETGAGIDAFHAGGAGVFFCDIQSFHGETPRSVKLFGFIFFKFMES